MTRRTSDLLILAILVVVVFVAVTVLGERVAGEVDEIRVGPDATSEPVETEVP